MTKRRLERDLEELEEEVLGELTPEERLQLCLEAEATENDVWLDKLRETAPTAHYSSTDLAFAKRGRMAGTLLVHVIYNLHTTYLQYELAAKHQRSMATINALRDDEPADEELEQLEEMEGELHSLCAELYTQYHGYQRFATETLGVSLETWVAPHPNGAFVLDRVAEVLDDAFAVESAEEWLNDHLDTGGDDPEDDAWVTLDAHVKGADSTCVAVWEGMEAYIP